jgi:hypothetical protein
MNKPKYQVYIDPNPKDPLVLGFTSRDPVTGLTDQMDPPIIYAPWIPIIPDKAEILRRCAPELQPHEIYWLHRRCHMLQSEIQYYSSPAAQLYSPVEPYLSKIQAEYKVFQEAYPSLWQYVEHGIIPGVGQKEAPIWKSPKKFIKKIFRFYIFKTYWQISIWNKTWLIRRS